MDTLRGTFDSDEPADAKAFEEGSGDEHGGEAREPAIAEVRPPSIGQDERRMQVRAYNHWASLLEDRAFPSIEDLEASELPDFGPYAVVLDFTQGIDDPLVRFLGEELGHECGAKGLIKRLSDVPPRSLLSRITDHYMQILANQAPIGFEAEFVNQRGSSILYRGILLPFSSNDETIDFICGVINWKEIADALTADELLLEIDQAIDGSEAAERELEPVRHHSGPMTDWADSPAHEGGHEAGHEAGHGVIGGATDEDGGGDEAPEPAARLFGRAGMASLAAANSTANGSTNARAATPDFSQFGLDDFDDDEEYDEEEGEDDSSYGFASLADYIEAPAKKALDLDTDDYPIEEDPFEYDPADQGEFEPAGNEPAGVEQSYVERPPVEQDGGQPQIERFEHASRDASPSHAAPLELDENAGLAECLASARELARTANSSEDRSRQALYAAVSRAYDVSLAAFEAPDEYAALIAESGLAVQERAPMTPVVKLVFGSDYDKTRLTEYAAVLNHAHRLELGRGALGDYLGEAEGGLKGVVKAERRLRREESGKDPAPERVLRAALAKKLRALEAFTFAAIADEGPEFALVLVRRDGAGKIGVLGEIDDDIGLIERAGKRLVG